jgi:hypothetical protein
MANLAENANPKRNPYTSFPGLVFICISAAMYVVKYLVPAFIELKADVPFDWYVPLIVLFIGLLLMFINDDYFARIFNRADKIAGKKTDTN